MQSFNQALARLALAGTVTQEEALATSTTPGDLRLLLKGVQSGSAPATIDPNKLKPDSQRQKNPRGF
jgi:Tfp pilus assembly ATPase PilU